MTRTGKAICRVLRCRERWSARCPERVSRATWRGMGELALLSLGKGGTRSLT
jgi:hypothetical protein